ncbi:MAG: RES family NAD+ phosphorylase [Verrucomicrobiota bacterium]
MPTARPIRLPAADFHLRPLPVTTVHGLDTLRLHGASYPAIQFRLVTSHRFSHPDAPGGLLYLADDPETCLMECFGDAVLDPGSFISQTRWMNQRVSRIQSTDTFRLCDLTETKTRSALKVDLPSLLHPDLSIPQTWGLAIQTHPENADGLCFFSRFTNRRCLVLFDAGGRHLSKLKSTAQGGLAVHAQADRFLDENKIALV